MESSTLLVLVGLMPLGLQGIEGFSFVDVAEEVGVSLVNVSGDGSGDYILGAMGNGAAFFDYDNDGDMDLLITNGSTREDYRKGGSPMLALYENQSMRFSDVTVKAGLTRDGWAMGVCVADYDNDGYQDFYLTAYGPNVLYRNNGDGTFEVAARAGVEDSHWSANCAFGDYDRDGHVDLYVANYLTFDEETVQPRGCKDRGMDILCGPIGLPGEPDALYRNNGDRTFTDVTSQTGIEDPGHYGLGVVFSDLDNDGWPDIYVANDNGPNFLFRNEGDGSFSEVGLISGTALSAVGRRQAGMGVGIGDYDGNGYFDIFVTNFALDTNTLYRNTGDMVFYDVTVETRASESSFPYVGWGTEFVDLDNDGRLDIVVANGHTYPTVDTYELSERFLQPKEVYLNLGRQGFKDVAGDVGQDLRVGKSSRGTAFGDYDNDGDVDLVVINMNDGPSLYRNDGGNQSHWIGFEMEGVSSNRDAIGARVEIDVGSSTQVAEVRSGSSYLSHNDMRLHFGLGGSSRVDRVRVRWPSGVTEEIEGLEADQYVTLREGSGIVSTKP